VLRGVGTMSTARVPSAIDWAGSLQGCALAWGLPHVALVPGLFVSPPVRASIWEVALAWMGIACIVNARRCRRTHCRYTGPFYLVMIAPVFVLGSGLVSGGMTVWLLLGAVILAGGKLIWWATEREWASFPRILGVAARLAPLSAHRLGEALSYRGCT
jgi:hypothetical protein